MSDETDNTGRDTRGRFTKGNPGGPGGARRRPFLLRKSVQEAVTPEIADALTRKAIRIGLEGNLTAIRFILEYLGGRPAEAPVEPDELDLHLPPLRTASDCSAAIGEVIQARLAGRINSENAQLMNDLITTRLKAIEAEDHERLLTDLETEAARSKTGHDPKA